MSPTPRSPEKREIRTTAYTHSEIDHAKYGRKTASGTTLQYGSTRSAAADWSIYPVGTQFRIGDEPYIYEIDDFGSALVGTETVDLYKPSKSAMRQWGVRRVQVTIIKWGCAERSINILRGRQKYRHCREMYENLVNRG